MIKKILMAVVMLVMGVSSVNIPVASAVSEKVFAADNSNAIVLTDCGNQNGMGGILCVLNLVVEVMSIGVGILGVIGISVTGIQYLTAGGSEEKTRKAKRRMLEIVIGLALYAIVYALLKWLLPSFTNGG